MNAPPFRKREGTSAKTQYLTTEEVDAIFESDVREIQDSSPSLTPIQRPNLDETERVPTLITPGENLLTNDYIEPLLQKQAKPPQKPENIPGIPEILLRPSQETLPSAAEEEVDTPSRPALLDLPTYDELRASQSAHEIQKRQRRISNKVRIALAVGIGVAIGLTGTALYKEYAMEEPKPSRIHKI